MKHVSFHLSQKRSTLLFDEKAFSLSNAHNKQGLIELAYSSPSKLLRLRNDHCVSFIFAFNGYDKGVCLENLSLSNLFFNGFFKYFAP